MGTLLLVGKWATAASFMLLALVTLSQWVRQRDRKNLYLALAVGLLGVVSLAGNVLALPGPRAMLAASRVASILVTDCLLVAFLLSGCALLLYRSALIPMGRTAGRVALGGLALGILAGLVPQPPAGTAPDPLQTVAVFYILGFWCVCVGEPIVRLWLRSRRLPAVQRARLRALSLGYGLIVGILVISVAAGGAAQTPAFQLLTQVVALLAVPVLYASFAPPRWLRRAWRAREEDAFAVGVRDLLLFSSGAVALAERAVDWGERLVGAEAGAIVAASGEVVAADGIEPEAALETARQAALDPGRLPRGTVALPLELDQGRGWLIIRAGILSPLFGADEVVRLSVYAANVTMALDRVSLLDALRASERAAREANEAKSTFLASMSHELRTPMGAILGFSDVLADGLDGELNHDQLEDVERIRTAGRHLLALLTDILDLSKIEAGKMEMARGEVDLGRVFDGVLETLAPLAAARSLRLGSEGAAGVVVDADEQRVRQILINLVSNGIKFTESGGVSIRATDAGGGMTRIAVEDTGIGIPEAARELVFDEFRQVDGGAARSSGGTGLGLAISRRLVTLHGGTMGVDSEVGRGSTFWFTLPTAQAPGAVPEGARPEAQPEGATHPDAAGARATPPGDPRSALPWGGLTRDLVVIVDDDPHARALIAKRLGEGGFRSVEAASGEEGLRLAGELLPLAITLDIQMPAMDGAEVLRRLSADRRTRDIPVVLTTALDRGHVGMELDRVGYAQKPFTKETLLDALGQLTELPPACTVMVIDDDPDVAELVRRSLDGSGVSVRAATDGRAGIDAAIADPPNLLFVDLVMPEMSGFEVITRLRASPATATVPIMVLSGKELDAEDVRALNGHIARFVRKGSLGPAELLATVRQIAVRGEVA
ncbi:MAG TPA: response regulator [Candidatus Dormibacteraeota bacterium]|nr:response regulator [Candidatus Dormibacteraeota bacterium]